jgi:hypothetical protein
MINGMNSSRTNVDTIGNINSDSEFHVGKNTSRSKNKKYNRMFEDDMENVEFKKSVASYESYKLVQLTDRIKSSEPASMIYEEEKVEGDLQEAAMRCNSLQNGGLDEYEEDINSYLNTEKNCNIFGQEVEKGEEIA